MALRPLFLIPLVLFGGLVAAALVGLQTGDQALPSMAVGKPAPPVQLTPLGDLPPPTEADLRQPGVKLVNFWASWCQPCRVEHPMLERLKAEGIPILGINYKDKPEAAQKFLDEMGNPYAMIGADAGRMALDWGVYGVPETYVIDGQGQVLFRLAGPVTEDNLQRQLRPAIEAARQGAAP